MDVIKAMLSSCVPKSARDTHGLLGRVIKTDAKKMLAERLVAAREMNHYSQTHAASLIGYATPAQLSQWELGRRQPPMHMLIRAAVAYRVSMDFLCGLSSDPDRDPNAEDRRQMVQASQAMFTQASATLADFILAQTKTGGPAIEVAAAVLSEGEKFHAAVGRFMERNKVAFEEDMPGSATLKGMHERFLENCLAPARALIDRFKFINANAREALNKKFRPADLKTGDIFDSTGA